MSVKGRNAIKMEDLCILSQRWNHFSRPWRVSVKFLHQPNKILLEKSNSVYFFFRCVQMSPPPPVSNSSSSALLHLTHTHTHISIPKEIEGKRSTALRSRIHRRCINVITIGAQLSVRVVLALWCGFHFDY